MGGIRTTGDLVARMQLHKKMRLPEAKKYVADKLHVGVDDLADSTVMRGLRQELDIGVITAVPGCAQGHRGQAATSPSCSTSRCPASSGCSARERPPAPPARPAEHGSRPAGAAGGPRHTSEADGVATGTHPAARRLQDARRRPFRAPSGCSPPGWFIVRPRLRVRLPVRVDLPQREARHLAHGHRPDLRAHAARRPARAGRRRSRGRPPRPPPACSCSASSRPSCCSSGLAFAHSVPLVVALIAFEAAFGWGMFQMSSNAIVSDVLARGAPHRGLQHQPGPPRAPASWWVRWSAACCCATTPAIRWPFIVGGAFCAVFLVIALVWLPETRPALGALRTRACAPPSPATSRCCSDRRLLTFAAVTLLPLYCHGQFLMTFPLLLKDTVGMSSSTVGLLYSLYALCNVLVQYPMGRRLRHADRLKVLAAASALHGRRPARAPPSRRAAWPPRRSSSS